MGRLGKNKHGNRAKIITLPFWILGGELELEILVERRSGAKGMEK